VLTSLTIEYWVNNAATPETYNWTGYLGLMETEDVMLPTANVWSNLNASNNVFHAEVSAPNGGVDGYAFNNGYSRPVEIPEVLPNKVLVVFKTNNAAFENTYEVTDDFGNMVYSRNGMSNNIQYVDTLDLNDGCYTFRVYDSGENGVSWWAAPGAGSGYVHLRSGLTGQYLEQFNGDFGAEINFPFTVNSALSQDEFNPVLETSIFPNPATNQVTVAMKDAKDATVNFYNSTGQLLALKRNVDGNRIIFITSTLSPGVYYVNIKSAGEVHVEKVVIL
jgi:hypothetical protein